MAGSLPPNINNVNIPLFINETSEFEISEKITSNIVDEIAIQNILKIINDEKNSDSTILGKITNVKPAASRKESREFYILSQDPIGKSALRLQTKTQVEA